MKPGYGNPMWKRMIRFSRKGEMRMTEEMRRKLCGGRIRAALDGAEIPGFPVAIGPALAAAALAGAVGWLALRVVVRVLDRGAFWAFGPWCLFVGALAWFFG